MYAFLLALLVAAQCYAQVGGTIRGSVTLKAGGAPLHDATVIVSRLGRNVHTAPDGTYEIRNLPPGTYEVVAHQHALTDERRTVQVTAGGVSEANFQLSLATVRQELTVTASGVEETSLESFATVTTLSQPEVLARAGSASLGELLDKETGIAKRSFGPGTSRPVVRGFDGDRVLVMQDGMRSGTLSSQSGDHGEPVDPTAIERVEVIRGPATLLYGSNAIGGVVNVLTSHHQLDEHPHEGVRGSLNALGSTTNGQAGGSGGVELGLGDWLLWASGGGQRTGDYNTPIGEIENSGTDIKQASIGTGRYGERKSFVANYGLQDGTYGVPFAGMFEGDPEENVNLDWRRHNVRFHAGIRQLAGFLEQFNTLLNYSDWNHKEVASGQVNTEFFNRQFTWQGTLQQKKGGRFSGSFGAWGMHRDYKSIGEEALAPPVTQDAVAAFGVEEIGFERFTLQLGARLEHNRFNPVDLLDRSFTGVSASAGFRVPLNPDTAIVASYSHSFRSPALEELYNNGPHVGNLAFEIGDPNLKAERGNGFEIALRHRSERLHAEFNGFYHRLDNFVFLAPTGEIDDGLLVADFTQGDARYIGAEARFDALVAPSLWLNLGFDIVDAQLTANGQPLPRIPPAKGKIGLDYRRGGLSIRPELILSNAQFALFPTETRTAGYAVPNLVASYTIAKQHVMHTFGLNFFNMTDRLYRNHLSFIKELAPEIGRGVRFSYAVHFY